MRKTLTEFMYKLFQFARCKPLLSQQYYFKTLTNELTNNRIVDKTFEKSINFQNLGTISIKQLKKCCIRRKNFVQSGRNVEGSEILL